MTRTLLLHIGSHKTGTTSLQVALRQGHKNKSLGSFSYLHARPRVDFNPLITCNGMGAKMHPTIRWPFFERRIADADRRGFGDCIISTEMLFWLANPEPIARLNQVLRQHFDQIRVIAYLRRQDTLALSHRKQVVLGRAAYQFYGAQLRALPAWRPHMMRYFDYATKLSYWEAAFGEQNVTVKRFQERDLIGGDTAQDFYAWAGLPSLPPQKKHNTSMSRNALLIGLWLRRKGYPRAAISFALKDLEQDETLRPGAAQAQAWLERFSEINARLAARYDPTGPEGYFDADFSGYPKHGNAVLPPAKDLEKFEAVAEAFRQAKGLPLDQCHPADTV